jgi:hypothetical protein
MPPFKSLIFLEYIYGRDHLKKKAAFLDGSKIATTERGFITNGLVKQTTKWSRPEKRFMVIQRSVNILQNT